jgi:hypothetical protein
MQETNTLAYLTGDRVGKKFYKIETKSENSLFGSTAMTVRRSVMLGPML